MLIFWENRFVDWQIILLIRIFIYTKKATTSPKYSLCTHEILSPQIDTIIFDKIIQQKFSYFPLLELHFLFPLSLLTYKYLLPPECKTIMPDFIFRNPSRKQHRIIILFLNLQLIPTQIHDRIVRVLLSRTGASQYPCIYASCSGVSYSF